MPAFEATREEILEALAASVASDATKEVLVQHWLDPELRKQLPANVHEALLCGIVKVQEAKQDDRSPSYSFGEDDVAEFEAHIGV